MNWSDERYVRLYVRDTAEWLCWPWEARAVLPLLLRKLDRSGVLATRLGARGVGVLLALPEGVVSVALEALLSDGCLATHELGYVMPGFVDAQDTPISDSARQRESRLRRRDLSRGVTRRHAASQSVTPILAVPSRTDPEQGRSEDQNPPSPPKGGKSKRPKSGRVEMTEAESQDVQVVLSKLSEQSGVAYTGSAPHTRLIVSRLRDGATQMDLRKIVAYCAEGIYGARGGWKGDPRMAAFLRPETLFGPETIAKYLEPARSWYDRMFGLTDPSVEFGLVPIPAVQR